MDVIFEISASKLFKKGPNLIWGKKKIFFCNPVLFTLVSWEILVVTSD